MVVEEFYDKQLSELKKMGYDFYESLARGKEPLTYTAKYGENKEYQVEVNSRFNKQRDGVLVTIDFDTEWGGRWEQTSNAHTFLLTSDNQWRESSYDGSELTD